MSTNSRLFRNHAKFLFAYIIIMRKSAPIYIYVYFHIIHILLCTGRVNKICLFRIQIKLTRHILVLSLLLRYVLFKTYCKSNPSNKLSNPLKLKVLWMVYSNPRILKMFLRKVLYLHIALNRS